MKQNTQNTSIASLFDFIESSHSPFFAVKKGVSLCSEFGFVDARKLQKISPNSRIFFAYSGSLYAFILPQNTPQKMCLIGAHTDSPCFKVKSKPERTDEGQIQRLMTEVYGGVLLNSWLDRDLGLSGQVCILVDQKIETRDLTLLQGFRFPQLAIHLDRTVNEEGLRFNVENHIRAYFSQGNTSFLSYLSQALDCDIQEILSFDLSFFDLQKPSLGGMNNEFIYSSRLDNLASCHAAISALCQQKNDEESSTLKGICLFHHEEVGSVSSQGASSQTLSQILKIIFDLYPISEVEKLEFLDRSIFISADMAHAVHASYPEKHDQNHRPLLNHGPVIKHNSNQRYATDFKTTAWLKQIAQAHNIPLQDFHARDDLGCGSTIGPSIASSLGISCIDIGTPILSMHSIREMGGSADHDLYISLLTQALQS